MNKYIPMIIGVILVCLAVWLFITPVKFVRNLFDRLDHLGYDLQLRTRVLTDYQKPTSPVAIIDIDNKSLQAEGRWPWPRSKVAQLVDKLHAQGASVIAFDIIFAEPQPNIALQLKQFLIKKGSLPDNMDVALQKNAAYFDEDAILAKSLQTTESVLALGFLPTTETSNRLPPPLFVLSPERKAQLAIYNTLGFIANIPILQQAAKGGGFINIIADGDGIIRRSPLLMAYKDGIYPSLALQAVLSLVHKEVRLLTPTYGDEVKLEGIKIGDQVITTDEKGQVLIPFIGPSYTFPFYSATDVLHDKIPKKVLQGKVLFVGTSATGLGDLQATSIQSPFPGVEIQATLVNGILENNFSYIPAWTFGANLFLTIFFGLLGTFLFPYFGPRSLLAIIVLLPPAILFLNNWFWTQTGLVISVLIPTLLILIIALLNIIYGYLFESRRRERLKEMFGQYVPAKHIDEMLKTSADYGLKGEDRDMTVLFADIRNFTSISESMSAAELVDLLNTFFTPMTESIFKHKGTIDKYVGDLIMAFWGAPLKDRHHAQHAIASALEMQKKLKTMQPEFEKYHCPELTIGIGLNSGTMSIGNMGSRYRRNYTVLGDQVNLASRVESLTKFYSVDIIVTENTQRNQPNFVFRKLDRVRVKGKKIGIEIYEVLCTRAELTPELMHDLELYDQALALYFQQKWEEAETIFLKLQQKHPNKKIYAIYLGRINEFKNAPFNENWDGIYTHLEK